MPIYWKQMLNAAIEGREFVLDGHPEHRLDWVYSKDVACLACKLLFCEKTPNMEYNASYSKCIGIYDFISCLDKIFPGHKVKLKNCERGGWKYPLCMDRAKQDIDFMPQFSLESGINDYINWYLEAHKSGKNEDSRS
ncbi:unnamed protein product [marine sediment metagenome]|uniref:NAD-dependent epimerase/dehydratase domain-containing protein n=1 Tax=marine sediment metagenome TaxID=412755 RepID=X0RR64_9ZZZZ